MNVLVTAGPTREALDPVRFLSNRSTGKMGYAIARAAVARGHCCRLVSGPTALSAPDRVEVQAVVSAQDMLSAVEAAVPWCDALIMCAAVADWRPATLSTRKLKKSGHRTSLELVRTPDILETVASRKGDRLFVGFAAETDDIERHAEGKMRRKGLDMIVANDVSLPGAGFASDTNQVHVFRPGCAPVQLPMMDKGELGGRLIEMLESIAATPDQ